ncbi:MAG: AMP-dependent synthetase [Acidimicrobiaceae bacterium]|jgi:acyl-CoA synthetase (AMP-forming)/AMP-acid ligase II|nr:AMP-dependent synthetase [Acidimicrobiaceae bacterium]|tara:strand:- start:52700 stop:54208 length:1509 start_codon:yes stop_codon:yes gene_type:complete
MNLMMLLEMASSGFGDRVAIGSRDGSGMTYQDLYDQSGRASEYLNQHNVEHISFLSESSPALPVALFAAAWAGLPFIPLNYRLQDAELQSLAERITPTFTISDGADLQSLLSDVDDVQTTAWHRFLNDTTKGAIPEPTWNMDPDEIAILLFTSGTTGAPKAAVLRHSHLVSYILGSVEFMGAAEEEATLVSVPPYHVAGMAAMCSSVYAGRRIVQLPSFDADTWIDLVIKEEVTHAMVVPTMLARIVERLDEQSAKKIVSLKALSYGGGKMPRPVIEKALELLPETNFVNAYGLTETSSTISVLGPEDHRTAYTSSDPDIRQRLASAGKPLPTLEVSIRDESGNAVSAGVSGEIWVRGEQVSGEYLGQGKKLTDDGWFPTNDGGSIDDGGYLFVEGRIDDIIIRGGENISPGEIEDVLLEHPNIRDAAAIGVPDEEWGEIIVAVVVLHNREDFSESAMKDFTKELLRSSRTPDKIIPLDELPYNETGKLLRRVIKADLVKRH